MQINFEILRDEMRCDDLILAACNITVRPTAVGMAHYLIHVTSQQVNIYYPGANTAGVIIV